MARFFMKKITNDWFDSAESDLMLIRQIMSDENLTLLAAFHAQQAVEKSFKAIIEEFDLGNIKSHSLENLYNKISDKLKRDIVLETLNAHRSTLTAQRSTLNALRSSHRSPLNSSNMRTKLLFLILLALLSGCVTQKKLRYLGDTPSSGGVENFPMDIPDYKLKPRDVLYITVKAMGPEGKIEDFLSGGANSSMQMTQMQGEGGSLYGYDVNAEGYVTLPAVGQVKVEGMTLVDTKKALQEHVDKVFKNATVECKLLSFRYTVIGEVKAPGTFFNYNNYLTVLEAVGKAGGITDGGNRDRVLVIRPYEGGTRTYRINLQDNKIFSSEAYTLLPNDVIVVEPTRTKIWMLNMPTFTSFIGIITATLLLLNYFK